MLALLVPIFFTAFLVVWTWAIVDSLRGERDYLWVVLLAFLPPLGVPLYGLNFLVLGDERNGLTAVKRRHAAEKRIRELRAAIAEHPILGQREELARALFDLGRYEEALAELKHLLDYDPEDPRVQYLTAQALERTGRTDAALAHYDYILEEAPSFGSWRAAIDYSSLLYQQGDLDKARAVLKRVHREYAIPEVSYRLAHVLADQDDGNAAAQLLDELIRSFEESPTFNLSRDRPWIQRARQLRARLASISPKPSP